MEPPGVAVASRKTEPKDNQTVQKKLEKNDDRPEVVSGPR
jgi:hypothetical protein